MQFKIKFLSCIFILFLYSCTDVELKHETQQSSSKKLNQVSLIVLGTVQDGGSPHIGCKKKCCELLFSKPDSSRQVVALGIIDSMAKLNYLIEATPDFTGQLRNLKMHSGFKVSDVPDGIFLTHAHIGHYTGLMYLGKEALNCDSANVYCMPRMKSYLQENGPWQQLVSLKNIKLNHLKKDSALQLSSQVKITPFLVPHRDEYSETVGYLIEGKEKKALFIPDIDKWSKWDKNILEQIKLVDYAFIDGTFFDSEEIQGRDISLIPHPFVIESMNLFKSLPESEKDKIYFIHFNHTNPLLNENSKEFKSVIEQGFHVAKQNLVLEL